MWKFVSGKLDVPQVSPHPLKWAETEGGLDTLMTAEELSTICLLFSPCKAAR